jgi:predicted nucleic acid-binding protein
VILDAFRIAERYRIGPYDGQIIAAALACGARRLFTEDLHHGLSIDGLELMSPFAPTARDRTARYRARTKLRRAA